MEDFCKVIHCFYLEGLGLISEGEDPLPLMPLKYLGMRAVWRAGLGRDYTFLQVADQDYISRLGRVAARNLGWKPAVRTEDGDYYLRTIEKEEVGNNKEMRQFFALGNVGFGHDEAVPYWIDRMENEEWDCCPNF